MLKKMAALDWGGWVYTLWSAGVSAGANAVVAGFAASTTMHYDAGSPEFWGVMWKTFIFASMIAVFNVLQKSPAPSVETVASVTQTTTVTATKEEK